MWFSLFTTVLILAATFYQGLQGLFSGLINCILAMLSAALAFGFYENLYFGFLADRQPEFGRAIALLGIFIIVLLVLRLIVDSLIKGNVYFPVYVDRAGGGIFGFFTAMIIVGMLSIGFQLLPFPPDFLGFSRFTYENSETKEPVVWEAGEKGSTNPAAKADWSKVKMVRQSTWLNSGGFTAALASHLSSNALRGRQDASFNEIHPDFIAEIYHAKANPLGPSRMTAKTSSLDVRGFWDMPIGGFYERQRKDKGGKPMVTLVKKSPPESGDKEWVVRVHVHDAKDDDAVRFKPEQVRLFARTKQDGPLSVFPLVGINDDTPVAQNKLVQVYPGEPIARTDGTEMDFVFQVPNHPAFSADFTPEYLEFKQDARAEITPTQDMNKKRPPAIGTKIAKGAKSPDAGQASPNGAPEGGGSGEAGGSEAGTSSGGDASTGGAPNKSSKNPIKAQKPAPLPETYGRVAVLGPAQAAVFSDSLPFDTPITNWGGSAEVSDKVISSANELTAAFGNNWKPTPGDRPPVQKFKVPSDKRLLQVSVERLQPGSYLGRAKSFAVENIGDFYLNDAKGLQHRPVGVYGLAKVGGQNTLDLLYLDASEWDFARLPKLTKIHSSDYKDDYALVYLFALPPGTEPVDIHTGGQPVDLKPLKLKAPQ